jgi:hypothetical protein
MNRLARRAVAAPIAIACLGGALAAAPATAATPLPGTYVAPKRAVQLGYDLQFVVTRGTPRIARLRARVLESCSGSTVSQVTTIGPRLTWAVRGGRFAGRQRERYDGITVYTTLEGRFTDARTAKGIVRQETIVAGSTCDTYALRFMAKRR